MEQISSLWVPFGDNRPKEGRKEGPKKKFATGCQSEKRHEEGSQQQIMGWTEVVECR